MNNMTKFTEEDLDSCWEYHKQYLLDILNGEYEVEAAREDLSSKIGSKYDPRSVDYTELEGLKIWDEFRKVGEVQKGDPPIKS